VRLISITKPGIIFGNLITLLGGFFLGANGHFTLTHLIFTMLGMSLVMACGCVFNNCIDRDIDQLMERTKNRAIAKGEISVKIAIPYGALLGILGLSILFFLVNPLSMWLGLFGLFMYVVVYTLYAKRKTPIGTEVGAISGAMPIVVGYCAATNHLDLGAYLLFLILFFWQMPHSYSIAIYRLKDYAAAGIPVLPVRKGIRTTKIHMLIYTGIVLWATLLPPVFGYKGWPYFIVASIVGLLWIFVCAQGFFVKDDQKWARKMFSISIINIMVLSFMMAV
jgi:protoheme IX farnesyltransferase